MEDAFPLVKQRYFESTIARMVEKGQSEAALRYAGDDAQLRHAVVQRLIEAGDAVTAAEYAGPDRAGRRRRRRRPARGTRFSALLLGGKHRGREEEEAGRAPAAPDHVARAVTFVDDAAGLAAAYEALRRAEVVGIDTEWAADLAVDADEQALGLKGLNGTRGKSAGGKKRGRRRRGSLRAARGHGTRAGRRRGDHLSADEAETAEEEETEEIEETEAELRTTQKDASSVVALLQVASATRVFLLDFPALLERCPALIAPTLGALLADDAVLKAGFGVAEDLRRLAALHEEAFGASKDGGPVAGVGPVVDLQHVWAAGTRAPRAPTLSLGGGAGRRRRDLARTASAHARATDGDDASSEDVSMNEADVEGDDAATTVFRRKTKTLPGTSRTRDFEVPGPCPSTTGARTRWG